MRSFRQAEPDLRNACLLIPLFAVGDQLTEHERV